MTAPSSPSRPHHQHTAPSQGRQLEPIIAPSVLAADFSKLGEQVRAISNADWVHVDVMDGHFVPNLSFGPDITKAIRGATALPLDVHLMIEAPERWVGNYVQAGADHVVFHVEATADPVRLARTLREQGVRAGVAVKPATKLDAYLPHLQDFDEVIVMSVEPGFGGQAFMPEQLNKVRRLREVIDARGLGTIIELDGGIDERTILESAAAGCDAFVAGSAVYKHDAPATAVERLREAAFRGYASRSGGQDPAGHEGAGAAQQMGPQHSKEDAR